MVEIHLLGSDLMQVAPVQIFPIVYLVLKEKFGYTRRIYQPLWLHHNRINGEVLQMKLVRPPQLNEPLFRSHPKQDRTPSSADCDGNQKTGRKNEHRSLTARVVRQRSVRWDCSRIGLLGLHEIC